MYSINMVVYNRKHSAMFLISCNDGLINKILSNLFTLM